MSRDSEITDDDGCFLIIAIIFVSAGYGGYYQSVSLGFVALGSLMIVVYALDRLMNTRRKR
jgi:hypothetical protein